LDLTYLHIRALEALGLAEQVRVARINEAVEEAA
jgi:fatty-acid desaturase